MCYTGQCEFEDSMGDCTVTGEELKMLQNTIGVTIRPCPLFTVDNDDEQGIRALTLAQNAIREKRRENLGV